MNGMCKFPTVMIELRKTSVLIYWRKIFLGIEFLTPGCTEPMVGKGVTITYTPKCVFIHTVCTNFITFQKHSMHKCIL